MKTLETERLILRALTNDDAESIFNNWAKDEEVTRYLTWEPHKSIEDTKAILDIWLKAYEDEKTMRYGVVLKSTNELIGMIDLVKFNKDTNNPMIGYVLGQKWWNNGYMTEACDAFVKELFAQGYEAIEIEAESENIGSLMVIEKNAFTFVDIREAEKNDQDIYIRSFIRRKDDPDIYKDKATCKLYKNKIQLYKDDLKIYLTRKRTIIGGSMTVLGLILIIVSLFLEGGLKTGFLIAGIVLAALGVLSLLLNLLFRNVANKTVDQIFAFADEETCVNYSLNRIGNNVKVRIGNCENAFSFNLAEIRNISVVNDTIVLFTQEGGLVLPNSEELRRFFSIK